MFWESVNGMKQGMLWYDSQISKDFKNRLKLAVSYFEEKYGFAPECCYVHPELLKGLPQNDNHLKIMADEKVLRNHIWMEFPAVAKSPAVPIK
jgi:hypothetical protein